jgi:hypothetical protein
MISVNPPLDPEAPGLDEETRHRRRALAAMFKMSPDARRKIAVSVGIYTPDGRLTKHYGGDG